MLQNKSIDIMDSSTRIINLKEMIQECQNNVNEFHDKWYTIALKLASEVGIQEDKKRSALKQTLRDNVPSVTISEFIRQLLLFPFLIT